MTDREAEADETVLQEVLLQKLESPQNESVAALLAWYETKRGQAGQLPARAAVVPAEIVSHLSHIALVQPEFGPDNRPNDFFYKILGSALVRDLGKDMTGRYVREYENPKRIQRSMIILSHVTETAEPLLLAAPVKEPGRDFLTCHSVFLPFAEDGKTVDHILFELQFVPNA